MSRRGGGRGKVSHKGRRRHFTDEEDLKQDLEKAKREQEWRERRGEVPSDDEEGGDGDSNENSSSEEEEEKKKGVGGLIEIENPNRVKQKMKKVTDIKVEEGDGSPAQLSRREREEIAKQQEKLRYQKLHAQGKTDQAKADLARLAIIRKERADAARKRQEEKEVKDSAAAAKGRK